MPNARILLVDEHDMFLESLTAYLSVQGFTADVALDGATALLLAKQKSFDLLITDYDMPGIDLFLRLRQVQPDIAGILITAALTETRRLDTVSAGMLAILEKPNAPATLLPFVEGIFPHAAEDAA